MRGRSTACSRRTRGWSGAYSKKVGPCRSPITRARLWGSVARQRPSRGGRRATPPAPARRRSMSACGSRTSVPAVRWHMCRRPARSTIGCDGSRAAPISCCSTARSGPTTSCAPWAAATAPPPPHARWDTSRWARPGAAWNSCRGSEGGIEAWSRLGEAMGVPRSELLEQRRLLPGVRFAVDAYVNFCRSRPWLEAVAASLTEMFAPLIVKERLAAMLGHYKWVDPDGLQYFKNRLQQAPRDAEYALGLVTERFRSPADQDCAVAALEFKCDVLWSLLDAVERGPLPGNGR